MTFATLFSADACNGALADILTTTILFVIGFVLTRPNTFLGRLLFQRSETQVVAKMELFEEELDEQEFFEEEPTADCSTAGVANTTPKLAAETDGSFQEHRGSQASLMDLYTSTLHGGRDECGKLTRHDSTCSTTIASGMCSTSSDDEDYMGSRFGCSSDLHSVSFWDQPEAAVNDDATGALETALASGNATAVDQALAAGLRHSGGVWAQSAAEKIRSVGIALRGDRAVETAIALGREGRAELALTFWLDEVAHEGLDPRTDGGAVPPQPELFSAVLEACVSSDSHEIAVEAMESSAWRSPSTGGGQRAVCALARWLARRRDTGLALRCYHAARHCGSVDRATHKTLLLALVQSRDMASATMMFDELDASRDAAVLSAMVCGHCSTGELPKAVKYFQAMRKAGMVPGRSLFDALLDGCASGNLPSLLEQVLADMEVDGVPPSNATVAALVRHYGKRGDFGKAVSTFEEMPQQHGLQLDQKAYGSMVSVCLHQNRLDLALDAFQRMRDAGLCPHARTCDALIQAHRAEGDLQQAVTLVEATLDSGLYVERATLEALLQLIGRRQQSASLGMPLLERLRHGDAELPDSAAKIMAAAANERPVHHAGLRARRASLQSWRNFSRD